MGCNYGNSGIGKEFEHMGLCLTSDSCSSMINSHIEQGAITVCYDRHNCNSMVVYTD